MIEVSSLSVTVNGSKLVDDVSFTVRKREWLCIIGPNGAGKTTLLRAMCGLVAHTGTTSLDDVNPKERAQRLSYCPQDALVPPHMNVLQYVLLGRMSHLGLLGLPSRPDRDIARESLAQVDASYLADRVLSTLSGGERRRVTVAQALAQRAPLMLLDEPVASLDIGHQQQLLELLDRLRETTDLTIVTTAHDLTLAGQYADRMMLLDRGRVVAKGRPGEVLTSELLAKHYDATVSVATDTSGRVTVTPIRGN